MRRIIQKIRGISVPNRLLAFVILVYAFGCILNPGYFASAAVVTAKMLYSILPLVTMVFVLLWLANHYTDSGALKKLLVRSDGWLGWLVVVVAGIFISGPPYALYPMLGELKKHGMGDAHLAAFLYNRNFKPQFLPVSIFYFGLSYTVVLSILLVLFSIPNGLIAARMARKSRA